MNDETQKQMNKHNLIPEYYFNAWDRHVREGLKSIEDLTQDIFSQGKASTILETMNYYKNFEKIITRYQGYLENKDNYCKLLDNGFYQYEPIEFLEVLNFSNKWFQNKDAFLWSHLAPIELQTQEPLKDAQEGNYQQLFFFHHGTASTMEQIENYIQTILQNETVMPLPPKLKLGNKDNYVVLVRKLNTGDKTNSLPLRSLKTFKVSDLLDKEERESKYNSVYYWTIRLFI